MSWSEMGRWDLDVLLPGASTGVAFAEQMTALEALVEAVSARADALGDPSDGDAYARVLNALVQLGERAAELHMVAICTASANAGDPPAMRAQARAAALETRLERAWTTPKDRVARCAPEVYAGLVARQDLAELRPMFDDLRAETHLLLPVAEAALYTELSEDGLHAWGRLYERVAGGVRVEVGDSLLSPAQALNQLENPDRGVRHAVFDAIQQAWTPRLPACADALTHIYGTRRVIQARLGVDPLAEPLAANRMTAATLEAVLAAAAEARPLLWRYMAAKARQLGLARLDWADLRAPLGLLGTALSWQEAQAFVTSQFEIFSPDMASFAVHAFENRWVESEDRAGKRPGAFCAPMPISKQSRVFMTFGGRMNSLLTLAHELGHAYHNHAILDLHPARQRLTSSLAETASTFAETLVRGAALARATDPQERLALLDQDLGDALALLANIPVRYHFEYALHALRAEGELDPDALSAAMVRLQREWYGPLLGEPHPLFWADKLHFYASSAPFYNFPYTFGYLFSSLVHIRAMAEGKAWAQGYVALLQDTGAGPVEAVAALHLGVNLQDVATWRPVLVRLDERVAQLEALVGRAGVRLI